jgi:hypothetical protein
MPLAMKLSNCDLGVASEGSLVLTLLYLLQVQMMSFNIYRYKNNLEIIVRELSMETILTEVKLRMNKNYWTLLN